ncbi:MAG: hypoxanthine phosphoribosyltransferase [Flavobacteriales bacterium]|nr:hypoxanthine phosphoribosyltransferase [Flavobacteriales bacterium]
MGQITLHSKQFEEYLEEKEILAAISRLGEEINEKYIGKKVLFVGVLNGAFMFCSDLLKNIGLECEISFIKLASYHGTSSTGIVKQLIGLNENLNNQHLIILEDIIDTGNTVEKIMEDLKLFEPASVAIACLLFKPSAYKKNIPIDFVGIEIPDDFIVGYGLDYDGLGRNLKDIYKLRN